MEMLQRESLFAQGERFDLSNYRSISVTPVITRAGRMRSIGIVTSCTTDHMQEAKVNIEEFVCCDLCR